MTPKILIIGNSGAGKSTAAEMIARHYGTTWTGTSEVIMKTLWEECYPPRHSDPYKFLSQTQLLRRLRHTDRFGDASRVFLRDAGNIIRKDDPAALAKACLEYGPIVEGVRTHEEYALSNSLFDLVIWIERPGNQPNATDGLRKEDADIVIVNDSSEEVLEARLVSALATGRRRMLAARGESPAQEDTASSGGGI